MGSTLEGFLAKVRDSSSRSGIVVYENVMIKNPDQQFLGTASVKLNDVDQWVIKTPTCANHRVMTSELLQEFGITTAKKITTYRWEVSPTAAEIQEALNRWLQEGKETNAKITFKHLNGYPKL